MASNYLPIDRTKPLGAALYDALRSVQRGIAELQSLQLIMVQQLTGATIAEVELHFGFPAGVGDAAKGELDSMLGKFTTDASVSNVMAARNQAAAKFGVV
jgi:hypothetical protein